jgi:hypothetical protein
VALPVKIARPPRGQDLEDWQDWAEEVERVINLLLAGSGETYTVTNGTTADVLGTLIEDLKTSGAIE